MNASETGDLAQLRKRTGPFGPARALLPHEQDPLMLLGSTLSSEAIELLVDNGYSQIPVRDGAGRIIGVFTWTSFGKRISDLQSPGINPLQLPIREAMEPPRFIDPEVYLDLRAPLGGVETFLL